MSSPASGKLASQPCNGRERGIVDVWLSAVTIWYLTGLLVALGFSFGFYLVRPPSTGLREHREVLEAFNWMDGKWYKQIASEGYHYDPDARSNVAFYPVYPLLGRAVMALTGLRAEAALLIVSNLSLLGALATLYFYARDRYRDTSAELADWIVLAAALFPTGCFFRFTYSESTFLLLTVVAMYGMLRRWPLAAIALIIGAATAARPVGVALLAPFVIHIFRNVGVADDGRRVSWAAPTIRLSLYLPLACWGLIGFTAYQYAAFGDPLASFKVQRHWAIRAPVSWHQRLAALATLEPVRGVYDGDSSAYWASFDTHGIPWFSLQFANPLFFMAGIGAVAFGAWRRWLKAEEVALAALLLFVPYMTRGYEMGMGSMGRFTAVAFPIYIVFGRILVQINGCLSPLLLGVSSFFLATYAALYAAAYVVF